MALTTGSSKSPSGIAATHGVDTAIVTAIRNEIEPNTGFWQFELRPWHYWTAIASAVVIAVSFALLFALGSHR